MSDIGHLVQALPEAARSPLGLVGFSILVVAWTAIVVKRTQSRTFIRLIESLSPEERKLVLERYGILDTEWAGLASTGARLKFFTRKWILVGYVATLAAIVFITLSIVFEVDNRKHQAEAAYEKGMEALIEKDFASAENYGVEATALWESEAKYWYLRSAALQKQGKHDESRRYLEHGFDRVYDGDRLTQARLLNLRALLFAHFGPQSKVIEDLNEALHLLDAGKSLDEDRVLAMTHGNIANQMLPNASNSSFSDVEAHYSAEHELLRKRKLNSELADSLRNHATRLVEESRYRRNHDQITESNRALDDAEQLMSEALAVSEAGNLDPNTKAYLYWTFALINQERGEDKQATIHYYAAIDTLSSAPVRDERLASRLYGDLANHLQNEKEYGVVVRQLIAMAIEYQARQGDVHACFVQLANYAAVLRQDNDLNDAVTCALVSAAFLRKYLADHSDVADVILADAEIQEFVLMFRDTVAAQAVPLANLSNELRYLFPCPLIIESALRKHAALYYRDNLKDAFDFCEE